MGKKDAKPDKAGSEKRASGSAPGSGGRCKKEYGTAPGAADRARGSEEKLNQCTLFARKWLCEHRRHVGSEGFHLFWELSRKDDRA